MHMEGMSDPLFRCFNRLIKANVLGTMLLVTGSHVMRLGSRNDNTSLTSSLGGRKMELGTIQGA